MPRHEACLNAGDRGPRRWPRQIDSWPAGTAAPDAAWPCVLWGRRPRRRRNVMQCAHARQRSLTRRAALRLGGALAATTLGGTRSATQVRAQATPAPATGTPDGGTLPTSGPAVPELAGFDA